MNNQSWEEGSVKIPAYSWAPLKEAIRIAWNLEQKIKYADAIKVYNLLLDRRRGANWFDCESAVYSICYELDISKVSIETNKNGKPYKPRQKNYPKANKQKTYFLSDKFSIGFNNENRVVDWNVNRIENGIALSRKTLIGKAFFNELEKIPWTSKTGGIFIGNDQHNYDEPYLTAFYGGVGARQKALYLNRLTSP